MSIMLLLGPISFTVRYLDLLGYMRDTYVGTSQILEALLLAVWSRRGVGPVDVAFEPGFRVTPQQAFYLETPMSPLSG